MNSSSPSQAQLRLAQLAAHLVVALVALVVVGGATRVMEAGLACPDWPLCFGSLIPGRQMNVQVFLEWFHRLDAFFVGVLLIVQLCLAVIWRDQLPRWLPWVYTLLLLLVVFQGALGALTVLQLLPSGVVIAHLAVALLLVALMSGLTQRLLSTRHIAPPLWWRLMSSFSFIAVFSQCLIGSRMATTWAAQRCLIQGQDCQWLDLHRNSAIPVTSCILLFVITSFVAGRWSRAQWRFLLTVTFLVFSQAAFGFLTLHFELHQPLITVFHQLVAALLVACLAALSCRSPQDKEEPLSEINQESLFEACHG